MIMYMLKVDDNKEKRKPYQKLVRDINIGNEDSELASKKQVQSAVVDNVIILDEDISKLRFED